LAGAAEELLGAHLAIFGKDSTFKSYRASGVELANSLSTGSSMTKRDMEELLNYAKIVVNTWTPRRIVLLHLIRQRKLMNC
jgi:hypothetical protein